MSAICTDEECLQALADNGNNSYMAAAMLAEHKAMTFLMRPSMEKRGDRTVSYAQQAETFKTLAHALRLQASLRTTSVYAGGIEASERQADAQDTSLNPPFARAHLHEHDRRHVSFDEARDD